MDINMCRSFVLTIGLLLTCLALGEAAEHQKPRIYEGEGEVRLVNPQEKFLVVKHKKIKGFMEALTTGHPVSSSDLLKGLKQGDLIKFKIDAARQVIIEISPVKAWVQTEQPGREEPRAGKRATASQPRVIRDVLATAVIDREPIQASSPISAEAGRLYYFTELVEVGPPRKILHVWKWQNRNVSTVVLEVQGWRFRTWSYKSIPPTWAGEWHVEARTPDGTVLSSKSFLVEPPERTDDGRADPRP